MNTKLHLGRFITFLAIVGLLCHLLFWLSLMSVIKPSMFEHLLENACNHRDPDVQGWIICDSLDNVYYYAFFTVLFVYAPTIVIIFLTNLLLTSKRILVPTWKIFGITLGIFTIGYAVIGLTW